MSTKRHHAEWLSLVEVSGPFLTMPVLEKIFPQGLDAHDPDHFAVLRAAYEEWHENQTSHRPQAAIHTVWITFVLRQTLALPEEVLAEGQKIPQTIKATVAEHGETLRPDFVVRNPERVPNAGKARLLVQAYPLGQNLDKPIAGKHWKASPATRMMELLHSTEVRLGLVTNGEHWMLVDAPRGDTTGFASWYGSLWLEEKLTLQAFRSLLGVQRFFSVPDDQTLEAMLAESATHQQEVTDQLGLQVRRAVEVLIQSLDRADQDHGRSLLADVPETVLYEAALTVMMRLVFLFCAEERGLLLLGDEFYNLSYAVSTLVAQLQEAADQHGEEVLERRLDAWVRLLSTFRAVYGGVQHERMKLPAYSGNLFNPDRFMFLEGRKPGTSWRNTPANPLPVNNRTVLHLLRSLQYLELQGEARRLSFRALDIEQIGHVYERLLDHTAKRATEPLLGVLGAKGIEPELALKQLESKAASRGPSAPGGSDDLIAFLNEQTGKSESALRNALEKNVEGDAASRLQTACGNEDGLFKRVLPFANLIRTDSFGKPVVIRKGSVYVTEGTDRRSSGTHYTPKSLTEPIVQYTLEPLVFDGPAEGKPKEEWKLRSARELLDLKICDMACGSAAFLVQTCRFLSELLAKAWDLAEAEHPGVPGITPEGTASTGAPGEAQIPKDANERLVYARRLVAQRCLYGVDKNPLAVEMAKLSLWLFTLAKDKPFTFLDHAIRCGDSLVGIHDLEQIKHFNLDPKQGRGLFTGPIFNLVDEAVALRKKIEGSPANTVAEVEAQAKLLADAEEKTARLRYAADLLLSVEFQPGNDKDSLHNDTAIQVGYYVEKGSLEEFRAAAGKALNGQRTFHWPLEFPEVMLGQSGFHAFVCNPPFMGGRKISSNFGDNYERFLKAHVLDGAKGSINLVLYFLLRGCSNLRSPGGAGFVATDSITESDTREVGMTSLFERAEPFRAISSRPWPGEAGVRIAVLHFYKGGWKGKRFLDEKEVEAITTMLEAGPDLEEPYQLASNMGFCSDGVKAQGIGFVIQEEEAQRILETEPESAAVVTRYIVGDDLNNHPRQLSSRWVVNFWNRPEEESKQYKTPWRIVVERVKPYRDTLTRQVHERCFWKFWDRREEFFNRVREKGKVIVSSKLSKHLGMGFGDPHFIYSEKVKVFDFSSYTAFSVLQSSLHVWWSLTWGSSTGETPAYVGSRCFDTFPFPPSMVGPNGALKSNGGLSPCDRAGEACYTHRTRLMRDSKCGLTEIYNRFHDPDETTADIQKLRALHVEMDKAVAAYGWDGLDLGHNFHPTKQVVRFTISETARREVLGRLLKLNHERYAEEVNQGLHENRSGKKGVGRGRKKVQQPKGNALFDDQEDDDPAEETEAEKDSHPTERPTPIEEVDTDDVMAAFRQVARGRGWIERPELLKLVSVALGYQRLGSKIEDALRGHLRAAIRRRIIEADGQLVRPGTTTMADYGLDELREVFATVMPKGPRYERDNVVSAIARTLGFARVTETSRDAIKSAINSAIRQGILGYEGSVIWRE